MLPENADRYTMLAKQPANDLPVIVSACRTLQMQYLVVACAGDLAYCDVYLFFDRQGMKNFMNGLYASEEGD